MKSLMTICVCLIPNFVMAQWAVYDDAVLNEIKKSTESKNY